MHIDESSYKAKIGVVSIVTINNKVIRIRYTYPKGKCNAFYVGIVEKVEAIAKIQAEFSQAKIIILITYDTDRDIYIKHCCSPLPFSEDGLFDDRYCH